MPTRTQRAGRTAAAALTAPSSQRRRADASDDWDEEWNFHVHRWRGLPLRTDWLSESAGSQLSPAACEKSWRTLEYKAPLSSIGANFLQLSPQCSFVGLLWVLCGPLRYLVVPQQSIVDDGVAVAIYAPFSRQVSMPTPHRSISYRMPKQ